jgi:deoxyribonuclease-4
MIRRIGAHVSAAGGLEKAIEKAVALGANCAQLFSGSPRVWQKRPLANVAVDKMFTEREKNDVGPIFTHALYLINLATDNPDLLIKSSASLQYELEFDSHIKGGGVVVHVGTHQGRGWETVQQEVVERMGNLLEKTPGNSTLLIENSAGQKGKLHSDLSEIKWTFDQLSDIVKNKRLGWCFDTCHAFAAGYSLPQAITEITRLDLWPTLKCIHVNDSRDPFDSGRDRHGNINDGQIPTTDLEIFLNHPQVKAIPLITEVPGLDNEGPDQANLDRIKKLIHS